MASNWGRVGATLAEIERGKGDAYERRLGELVRAGRQEEGLRQDMMKTGAMSGIRERLLASGLPESEAALGEAILQGELGSDYSALQQGLGRQQERGFRQSAVDAYGAGGAEAANQYRAGLGTGMIDATQITQGQAYNPTVAPTSQEIQITPLGQSVIGANQARAGASQAQAGAARALEQARLNPTARTGRAPATFTDPGATAIALAFGDNNGEINRNEYQRFLQWRTENPEIRSGAEALAMYLSGDSAMGEVGGDGNWRPNPSRLPPDGIPEVDSGRSIGDIAVGDLYYNDPATGVQTKAPRNVDPVRQQEAMQALKDARRAIKLGRVTKEEAVKRLRAAGFENTAGRL